MTDAKKATKKAAKSAGGFSDAERQAMKERAAELKSSGAKGGAKKAADEKAVLEKIAEMPPPDRALAERIHAIVLASAPDLAPKTWYGMPAYAKDGKVVCFFQAAAKFEARYATLGFNDPAMLDDGNMWATAFAVTKLTAAEEKKVAALVKKAAS
jgi:uncharacterized protein YdhG (YjbR/CyaY superfamily)